MSHHETYENDLESLELDGMLRTPHYHRYSIVDAVAEREGEVGSEGDVGVAVGGTLERRKALLEEVEGMLGRLNLEVAFDTVDVGDTVQHGEGEDNQGLEEEEEEDNQGLEEDEEDNQGLEEGEIPQSHRTPEDEEETEDGTDKAKKKKKKKAKKKRGGKKKSIVARQRGELETVMSASSSSSSLDGHVAKENVEDNLIGVRRVTSAGGCHIRFHD